jgi:chromosome segregation protein
LKQFNEEIQELETLIKQKNSEIKEKSKQEAQLYTKFKGLLTKRDASSTFLQKQELKINNEQNKTQIFDERINNLNLDKAKVISELTGLRQEFEEFKSVPLRKGLAENQLRDEINKFEALIKNLGNVNLRALEIYKQVQEEYKNLTEKSSRLSTEKEDVFNMIAEVESKKTFVFMKTFNEINKNFETIFSQLTTKGTAQLVLENPEKPLEEGVQIMVKIAQNKYLDIKSLSGGEKTLTALAFIFSIQEHDPASFYLLDEVDAALDKKNSEKLSELIKKYSSKAQYIVISHNDPVISGADKLYGVSMHKDGISHVVSLEV